MSSYAFQARNSAIPKGQRLLLFPCSRAKPKHVLEAFPQGVTRSGGGGSDSVEAKRARLSSDFPHTR